MALDLDEKTLESVANNGEMDYDKWPSIIEPLLQRLNHIVYNEFPLPRPYQNITRAPLQSSPTLSHSTPARDLNPTTQAPSTPVRNLPPVPPFPNSSATPTSHIPDSLPPSQDPSDRENTLVDLPTVLLQLLTGITQTLRTAFSDKPPHTIQRLAELILHPKSHYKTLPAWLRALDRVVSVSSSADIFPLSESPALVNGVNGDRAGAGAAVGGGILWNNNTEARNGYDRDSLGSDESLGGALLTPIPWLRNGIGGSISDDDGEGDHSNSSLDRDANGLLSSDGTLSDSIGLINSQGSSDPLVPEREDGAVTQGELMRMEQEAGVVPITQNLADINHRTVGSGADSDTDQSNYVDEGDNLPHARGPDIVGSVDMGRVGGKDVQLSIGSPPTSDDRDSADPNDAQTVLSASHGTADTVSSNPSTAVGATPSSTADSDDFVIVTKDTMTAEEDAMQLDEVDQSATTQPEDSKPQPSDGGDGDIVLADVDSRPDEDDIEVDSTHITGNDADAAASDTSSKSAQKPKDPIATSAAT